MHELNINRFEVFIVTLFNNVSCFVVASPGENFNYERYFFDSQHLQRITRRLPKCLYAVYRDKDETARSTSYVIC